MTTDEWFAILTALEQDRVHLRGFSTKPGTGIRRGQMVHFTEWDDVDPVGVIK